MARSPTLTRPGPRTAQVWHLARRCQSPSIQLLDVATRKVTPLEVAEGICCPRWSPDGRYLLASHADYQDLLLYDFSMQKWSTIVKDKGTIGYMEWTADSKHVVFDTFEVEEPAFHRIRISDAHLETIMNVKEMRRYYGEVGPWSGMAPDGSPLLVRDTSKDEFYALDLQLSSCLSALVRNYGDVLQGR